MVLFGLQVQCFAPKHCDQTIPPVWNFPCQKWMELCWTVLCTGPMSSGRMDGAHRHHPQWNVRDGLVFTHKYAQLSVEALSWHLSNKTKTYFFRLKLTYVVAIAYFTVTVCRWRWGFEPLSTITASWQMWNRELMLIKNVSVKNDLVLNEHRF